MKIKIISLGCSKNLTDSQKAMTFLVRQGHDFVDDPAQAEAIIINTCAFINDAKEESVNTILYMADYKEHNCRKLIVMGCLSQRYRGDLEELLPEVDRFITIDEYDHLEEVFSEILTPGERRECDLVLATHPWSAYLKIADGCNNRCAFCAIPNIRGRYKSVPMEQLLQEARQLASLGVRELNLIAQDTTKYGIDIYGKLRLTDLLKELNGMDFHWIRILYMYPDELSDEMIDEISRLDKVLPYFDMPVQHGSDRLLAAMYRRGDSNRIRQMVSKIRNTFEDPTLRTTVIVGFPGETKDDFRELFEFVHETRWDHLGAFMYSLEENTPAYEIHPRIAARVSQSRYDRIMTLQQQITQENGQKHIGQTVEVLIEGKDALRNIYQGRSSHQAPDGIDGHVRFTSSAELKPGTFVKVRITAVNYYDWRGEAVI